MKTDDFENQLQRQPLRTIPPGWRREILAAARAEAREPEQGAHRELLAGWRLLLSRIPLAWAAVAALWLGIIGANFLMSGPAITVVARSSKSAQAEVMTVGNLQRPNSTLLASLLSDTPGTQPINIPPALSPKPRSDRRRDDGMGDNRPAARFETIA